MQHPDLEVQPNLLFVKQQEVLSALMRSKKAATNGQKVNACPFGCTVRDLDDNGYCRHLIGVSEDGKKYEPMVKRKGRRIISVEREKIMSGEMNEDGTPDFEWGEPILPKVLTTDRLVRITTCYRVYRNDKPIATPRKGGRKKPALEPAAVAG